jgi:hypothetical protein
MVTWQVVTTMDDGSANPIYVALLCAARCLIPLVIMLGISYLLRKFGLVKPSFEPPKDYQDNENNEG